MLRAEITNSKRWQNQECSSKKTCTGNFRQYEDLCDYLGGTAVGTGLNTRVGFAEKVAAQLAEYTGKLYYS